MVAETQQELEMATPGEAESPPATNDIISPTHTPFGSPNSEIIPEVTAPRILPPLQRVPPSLASPEPIVEVTEMLPSQMPAAVMPTVTEVQPVMSPAQMPLITEAQPVIDMPEEEAEADLEEEIAALTSDNSEPEPLVEEFIMNEILQEVLADAPEEPVEDMKQAMDNAVQGVTNAGDMVVEEVTDVSASAHEVIEKAAENVMENVRDQTHNVVSTLGNKMAQFFGGNLRKVKSLLHIHEKTSTEEALDEATKNLSSSTGNLDSAVRKSRACSIL